MELTSPNHSSPKRKSVVQKYAEKLEKSTVLLSDDQAVVILPLKISHQRRASVFVVPLSDAGDLSQLEVPLSIIPAEEGTTFIDPLSNVITASNHGSALWSSNSEQSISEENSSVDYSLGSDLTQAQDVETLRRKSLVEEALLEWKSLVTKSLSIDHLFSLEELDKYLPQHHLRVFIGTWNVNGQENFGNLFDFLFPKHPAAAEMCDLYAIGSQEGVPEFRPWEIALQKTLGLSHVLYASESVGTIHISLFLRRDLIWFCTKPLVSRHHLRLINQKNSKG